ncbi:UDP-N-acetylglucosamine 4-epimerase (UDP-GlcNAc 4-epimerase) [Escherichia coli]|uniref:UDP-N-acetylglucosamine 4-epimerase (UDP-GlcNAc 4-epimerase) n=1 Tax=Escherichia coli TaxID=562 RepID=A0A376SA22_ECOLX|nr:UDP-N-acetylglucosamine 4-epimerase (UDP-GlcNAc 4-epimerase) [Escherichia coli]
MALKISSLPVPLLFMVWNKHNPDENHPHDPFNHYGKSKWQAEEVLREWV